MRILKDVNYSKDHREDCTLDAYIPDCENYATFVYMHGGGLINGDKGYDGERLANYFIERGVAIVSLNYRMYNNAKYPEFIEDCAEAIKWVKDNVQPKDGKLFVGGSSAGGYLSMMLCFDSSYFEAVGLTADDIDGYIHDAGQPTAHFNVLTERGIDSRRIIIDESAPLYHIGKAAKYPPMLFMWSDNDMENRHEQLMLTISTLRHFRYDMSTVETIIRHGGHCHYLLSGEDKSQFEFSSLVAPFIEKYSKV